MSAFVTLEDVKKSYHMGEVEILARSRDGFYN